VTRVMSHPQATAQCAAFLHRRLQGATIVAASSTAEAVRAVTERAILAGTPPHAAIGTRHAAELYGATILAEGIEDDEDNTTRFAWIARRDEDPTDAGDAADTPDASGTAGPADHSAAAGSPAAAVPTKTALVFWGAGDLAPGWLVACLNEFAARAINLTRIESRPRRVGLGHYMFFCDLTGDAGDATVAEAIAALSAHCEAVRVLGSFPAAP